MARITVIWDDAAIRMACAAPSGPVGRAMRTLADQTVNEMKRLCPVYTGGGRGPVPGHPRQTARASGTLRSSIRAIRKPNGDYIIGPTDTVRGQPLGAMIERGTPAHGISSTGPWPLYSAAAGRYFGRHVNHPGTAPHPFIAPAAQAMNGRRVVAR